MYAVNVMFIMCMLFMCVCVCSRVHGRSLPTFILLCPRSRPVATWRCLRSLREICVRSPAMTASPSSPTGTSRLIVITFLVTHDLTCGFKCRLAGYNSSVTVRIYICYYGPLCAVELRESTQACASSGLILTRWVSINGRLV